MSHSDMYHIDGITVTAKSYKEAAEKAMTIRKFDKMDSYKKIRRELVKNIALEIAQFYHEYYNSNDMTETDIEQFINNIIPIVKRDAQNALYDMADDIESEV